MITAETLWRDLTAIRAQAPVVLNLTNYVVMNTTANALLAAGASPIMAHAPQELEEMVNIASSVVINIGTLDDDWLASMRLAARLARAGGKPLVLDPVGAGASRLRTETSLALISEGNAAVIRGNASEILALCRVEADTRGVDSSACSREAEQVALELARTTGAVVSVSGQPDVIAADGHLTRISNGHAMMTRVTGLGCTATALTGAFLAVNRDAAEAAAHAMGLMGIAGEVAAELAIGPGTLQLHLLDCLHTMTLDTLSSHLEVH